MTKRGQITFFVIIGIFILLVFGFMFHFSKSSVAQMNEDKDLDSDKHKKEITNYVEECMLVTLNEGIEEVGIKDMSILEGYIDDNIGDCIDGFSDFNRLVSKNLRVEEEYAGSNIDKFKRVNKEGNLEIAGKLTLDYEVVFHYNDYEIRLDYFEIIAPLLKDDLDIKSVTFLPIHTDPTEYELLYDLDVSTGGGFINYDQDGTSAWPTSDVFNDGIFVCGNPFIIFNYEGKWYGTSHEWMGGSQKSKNICSVNGHHMIADGYIPDRWVPEVGETYYFMVTSLSRLGTSSVNERTKIKKFVWTEDTIQCIDFMGN